MAANNSELRQLLLHYINSRGAGRERMREVLQTTSVEVRYNTLMSVRGPCRYTAVDRGAVDADLDSLKCMMSGFTSDQLYNIVKAVDMCYDTAVYIAALYGHTDIIMFLLSKLSLERRFNILKMQRKNLFANGSTALHAAAERKHTSTLQAMLTSVSPGQQEGLLNIKDRKGKTIANIIPLPELPYDDAAWTKMELDVTNQKLAEVEKQQKATVDQLKADLAKQSEDNTKQVEQQTKELSDANQKTELLRTKMNERMEAIEKLCEKFVKQGQELRNANQNIAVLRVEMGKQMDDNKKLNEKCEQQGRELNVTNQKLAEVEKQQNATIEQLKVDLAKQREDNAKQVEQQTKELRNANQKTEMLRAVMDKQLDANEKLNEKCEQQGQDLGDASQKIEVLEADNTQLRGELRNMKQKMDGTEAEVYKLTENNTKLSERCEQQGQELSNAKEQITLTMASCMQQRSYMDKQAQDQDIIVDHKLDASNKKLQAELDRQREENAELAERAERCEIENMQQDEELRSLIDRQAGMEKVIDEMEEILRQPICIGPEMNQEYEGH